MKKIIVLIFILFIAIFIYIFKFKNILVNDKIMYLASDTNVVSLYSKNDNKLKFNKFIPRKTKVIVKNNFITYKNIKYVEIFINDKKYYVEDKYLVSKLDDIVLEKYIYVKITTNIIESIDDPKIIDMVKRNDKLEVLSYENIDKYGYVDIYKVKYKDNIGYVYGKYLVYNKEDATKNDYQDMYDNIYSKVSNLYGGGSASNLDYYKVNKPNFDNNLMPDSVYSLYLNCSSNVIKNIDKYIEFAHDTKINTFVVDIKDNESPAYPSKVFKELSPTNYEHAINSYDDYKSAIDKLKSNGFYVVGRITVFKDSYYIKDNPLNAILDINTNKPYSHNNSYWPSAYNRDVWYYNVSLAIDAIKEFGFNEINFDYVRFPDRMQKIEKKIDLGNIYNEDKTQAIERFLRYATDLIHEYNVYVSADVFGETTTSTYTTAYGQYWPSISNIVDVISAMPYPDHFSDGYYGIRKPWNHPYELLKTWGTFASDRQKETISPAKVRTWVQAYDVMKYVDRDGIKYGSEEVKQEIKALYDSGLNDGYITWLSNSSIDKYIELKEAFKIDYMKEYRNE